MCIILDLNAIPCVFDAKAAAHREFRPVFDWINSGRGKIVYGGNTYKAELSKASKYFGWLKEQAIRGKLVLIDDGLVDNAEAEVRGRVGCREFNDCHIIAIVIVSGCRLICTLNKAHIRFLKTRNLYPKKCERPKIYSSSKNKDLLVDDNIAECCKTVVKKKV